MEATMTTSSTSTVSTDDPDLAQAMAVVSTLTEAERQALILRTVQAALDYVRTGDVAHVTGHARNLHATLYLRGFPEYVEAVRRRPCSSGAPSLDIGEVLASLSMPG
jgi:hypothetical protein